MAQQTTKAIWEDLLHWQNDISKKDTLLDKRKPIRDQVSSPIRKSMECIVDQQKPIGLNQIKTPATVDITADNGKVSSLIQKAQVAKEKGNKYFQQQQYPKAIQSYSEAIDLDPTNPVYFVNRAMAYLKVNNYLQAEQDCSKCLALQPNHVKALWRRGIALRSLGRSNEARKDFERALAIEPGNKLIVDELNKTVKEKVKEQPTEDGPLRQLGINVINEAYEPTNADADTNKAPSLQPKERAPASVPPSAPATMQTSKADTQTALQTPPSPLANDTKTISPSASPTAPTTLSPFKLVCPRTNYEFERDWKSCKRRGDDVIYQYLQCIPPASYATLFKSSLEPDQFEKIVDILDKYYVKNDTVDDILQVMTGLSQVKRLDMLLMFLGKQQKKALENVFAKLATAIPGDDLLPLAKKFSVSM